MKLKSILPLVSALTLLSLCSCQTHTQQGALTGGLGGAALGAIIADDAGKGALVGGAIGAAAGAAIGSGKDKREGYRY